MTADLTALKDAALQNCAPQFKRAEEIAAANTLKILTAMREAKVAAAHFNVTSGYAYDDWGRQKLDEVFAKVFGTEAALVRGGFVSGTHALATVLLGILRPGDELAVLTGKPYDTMQTVIGYDNPAPGSLKEFGVRYRELPLTEDGRVDLAGLPQILGKKTKLALIQRSCGYKLRPALTIANIAETIAIAKKSRPDIICFVDNCYGEFVEEKEPTQVGADIMAGSLIKNPGGGLAPTGGYVAGRKDLVALAANRLTAPGLGDELGASLVSNRLFFQGLFLAPHTVAQAIKGAVFAAEIFSRLGYKVYPRAADPRSDIIEAIELGSPERLIAFCRGVQKYSPVDAFAAPEPGDMPGYADRVIMAAGTFVQGASIELSADGPLRAPYNAYLQGALTFEHALWGIMGAAAEVTKLDN